MIGAIVGAIFCGSIAELINSAILGNAAIAQLQAYARVSGHCILLKYAQISLCT
ncbi:hypothetical protein ACSBR2_002207 [Camellia fascicularis]